MQGRIQEFLKGGGGVKVLDKAGPYRNFQTETNIRLGRGG